MVAPKGHRLDSFATGAWDPDLSGAHWAPSSFTLVYGYHQYFFDLAV